MGWIDKLFGRANPRKELVDGLLHDGPLAGPYTHRETHPLIFASGVGPGLALVSVYDTPTGPAAFVAPANLGEKIGSPMLNFVESVATELKALVPDVASLVLMWPADDDNRSIRVWFEQKLDAPAPSGGRTVIITDETTHASTPGGRTEIYGGAMFWNYRTGEEPFTIQDIPERGYTYADVDQHLADLPGGQAVIDGVLEAKQNAWEGRKAIMREWGLS